MKQAVIFFSALAVAAWAVFVGCSPAKPPERVDLRELGYTLAIEGRTTNILKLLELSDPVKSNQVHDIIIAQYRALRTRDEILGAGAKAAGRVMSEDERKHRWQVDSKALHQKFLSQLSALLSPVQIEKVKDKMTYNKVKVTFDAYCSIIPGLTDEAKERILKELKQGREEAMDGGSASEKSQIFGEYKEQINEYLKEQGYDVEGAYRDWSAKQAAAKQAGGSVGEAQK